MQHAVVELRLLTMGMPQSYKRCGRDRSTNL